MLPDSVICPRARLGIWQQRAEGLRLILQVPLHSFGNTLAHSLLEHNQPFNLIAGRVTPQSRTILLQPLGLRTRAAIASTVVILRFPDVSRKLHRAVRAAGDSTAGS